MKVPSRVRKLLRGVVSLPSTLIAAAGAPWRSIAQNRMRQRFHPGRKIFLIGPNRCATTTFHTFFKAQGLRSIHWREQETILAREIELRRHDDEALRAFLSRWTVFSDFVYLTDEVFLESHTLYEQYQRIFPDAYFILNDRDVERWIASRLRHREGGFLERYCSVRGCGKDDAIQQWREDFLAHRSAALAYFKGHPRFLHFNIDKDDHSTFVEASEIDHVIDFLRPDFRLSNRFWSKRNTERRALGDISRPPPGQTQGSPPDAGTSGLHGSTGRE